MAVDTPSISRPLAPTPSLDYDRLYLEGLQHIEALSGKIWTDYNAHDPGITILEVLCYAITELGYRTDFEMGNIVEPDPSSTILNDFFSLAQIASSAPLTIADYRKVIIDIDGIKNAWLEKLEGENAPFPALYLKKTTGANPQYFLNAEPTIGDASMSPNSAMDPLAIPDTDPNYYPRRIDLKGLYNIYLQFEEHPDLGDLNDNSITTTFNIWPIGQPGELPFQVEIEFPLWENLSSEFDEIQRLVESTVSLSPPDFVFEIALKDNMITEATGQPWVFQVTLIVNPDNRPVELPLTLRVVDNHDKVLNYAHFKLKVKEEFLKVDPPTSPPGAPTYSRLQYVPGPTQPEAIQLILDFMRKRKIIQGILEEARTAVAEHRNLCEDFDHVYPMSLQEIGLDLELVVAPNANYEQILAQVFHAMENYLSPALRFYSLREMLDKGYRPEEIFEGPWLCNGFLDSNEEAFTHLREILYTSDLVQEFMKIEGVTAVRTISLSRYVQGILDKDRKNLTECLCLEHPERMLARLNYSFSHITMNSGNGKFESPDIAASLAILAELKAVEQLQGNAGKGDFEIPKGTYSNLAEYYSIQHEFPINYAIGVEGLAPNEPVVRKAQAKQLKAYLLFFEQLLANYHSQLANLRTLFSYEENEKRTYFTQALFEVPRIKELLLTAEGLNDTAYLAYINDPNPAPTNIRSRVNALAETPEIYQDRRHRFLNHLLARFNESFSEYAAYVFSRNMPEDQKYDRLIADQARFLRNYAIDSLACSPFATDRHRGHSNERGAAFNYQLPMVNPFAMGSYFGLNSLQVEGLKKRMVYLTGIPKVEREFVNPYERFIRKKDDPGTLRWGYELKDEAQTMGIFRSMGADTYATEDDVLDAIDLIYSAAQSIANFSFNVDHILTDPSSNIVLGKLDPTYVAGFLTPAVAYEALRDYLDHLYNIENFHIVEHILLRPRGVGWPTMTPRMYKDCRELDIEDPYSFRISVMLPFWAGRFTELDFRRMFKKLMRQEAPAHVYIHFYLLDARQMLCFEHCWNDWLNGEWLEGDLKLLWEIDDDLTVPGEIAKGPMLQENAYNILVERRLNTGEDGEFFVDCLAKMRNLGDAYYVEEPIRILDQWHNCELIAYPVEPDSAITGAWLDPLSPPLPPGVCLNHCTGEIRVSNELLLHEAITPSSNIHPYQQYPRVDFWPLIIVTMSESGELTYHNVTLHFIDNGPAIAHPLTQVLHIEYLEDSSPSLVTFTDQDGPIIMAEALSWNVNGGAQHNGGLPPGMTMDPYSGEIKFTSKAALQPGLYKITVSLMDNQGGSTVLTVTINLLPDIEAVATVLVPIATNQDAYHDQMVLAKVTDADGDLTYFEHVQMLDSLATLGLGRRLTTGSPVYGELYIANLSAFQSALTTRFSLSGGYYNYTLKFHTKDIWHGESDVLIPLKIRRDNEPVFVPMALPVKSLGQFTLGMQVGTITEIPDGGVHLATPLADFTAFGLAVDVDAGIAKLSVENLANFKATMNLAPKDTATNIATLSFQVAITDVSGGNGTANCYVKARLDQAPVVYYYPYQNVDKYVQGQTLVWITDLDGTGVVSASPVPSNALSQIGLKIVVDTTPGGDPGQSGNTQQMRTLNSNNPAPNQLQNQLVWTPPVYPGFAARIVIETLSTFVAAVQGNLFTVINASTNLVQRVVTVNSTDSLGNTAANAISIRVIRDIEATVLSVRNGQRRNTYLTGDVLFRFQDNDAASNFTSTFTSSLPLPAGTDKRLVAEHWEIFVSNPSQLVAGQYPRTISLSDTIGGKTDVPITISILKRLVTVTFTVQASPFPVGRELDIHTKVPGLYLNSLTYNFPKSYGTVTELNDLYRIHFDEGTGFYGSVQSQKAGFAGTMGSELVDVELYISPSNNQSGGGAQMRTSQPFTGNTVLNSSTNTTNSKSMGLTSSVGKLVTDLNFVKESLLQPQLSTTPQMVLAYTDGKMDAKVAADLGKDIVATVDEIERLQKLVSTTLDQEQADARASLAVYVEIYRQQLLAAFAYAGDVRNTDLSGETKVLFDLILAQNSRIL